MMKKLKNDFLFLSLIVIFIIINWLLFLNIEKLAQPDFYKYFFASKKLFAGNLKIKFIPPLFPFLLGVSGRIMSFFTNHREAFVLGAKILSGIASAGVICFTYLLLKRIIGKLAIPSILFIAVSPFFLKFIVSATTDILYLFFVIMSFYLLFERRVYFSIVSITSGLLTRFEGVLLVFSGFINYLKLKKKNLKWVLIVSAGVLPVLYLFYKIFARRLIDKIFFIIQNKSYLFFFKHPMKAVEILYANILYFVPHQFPGFLKWFLFFLLLFLFFIGVYYLIKKYKSFGLAILFYEVIFFVVKGYMVNKGKPEDLRATLEIRRMLSFVFLFYVIVLIGLYFLINFLNEKLSRKIKLIPVILSLFLMVIITIFKPMFKDFFWLYFIFLFIPLFAYYFKNFSFFKKIALVLIFSVFFTSLFYDSFKKSSRYIASKPNKAGFAIAQWMNYSLKDKNKKICVYSNRKMIKYYLKRKLRFFRFLIRERNIYENEKKLIKRYFRELRRRGVDFVIFDTYMNPIGNTPEVAIKNMLYRKQDKDKYFKIVKYLSYKNQYVGAVLKPKFGWMEN